MLAVSGEVNAVRELQVDAGYSRGELYEMCGHVKYFCGRGRTVWDSGQVCGESAITCAAVAIMGLLVERACQY
jgi:hypothetical protein